MMSKELTSGEIEAIQRRCELIMYADFEFGGFLKNTISLLSHTAARALAHADLVKRHQALYAEHQRVLDENINLVAELNRGRWEYHVLSSQSHS